MRKHAAECPTCAARESVERDFDRRVANALGRGGARSEVDAVLATARARTRRRPFRVHALRAAAVLFACSTGAWFLCLPPFECAYVSAIEEAADPALRRVSRSAPREGRNAAEFAAAEALALRVHPPAAVNGLALVGTAEPCIVYELGWEFPAVRATYGDGAAASVVVWCDSRSQHPSFRHAREHDGAPWWTTRGERPTFASFRCDRSGIVCSVVSPSGAAMDMARAIRRP